MWLIHIQRAPLQGLTADCPFTFTADNFPGFPAGNRFCDLQRHQASRCWLITEIGMSLLNPFEFQRGTYSHYWHNSGKLTSAISSLASRYQLFAAGASLKQIIHIFLLMPLKEVFCDIKSQFPLNSIIKCPRLYAKKDLSIEITFDPSQFRWTVPLNCCLILK